MNSNTTTGAKNRNIRIIGVGEEGAAGLTADSLQLIQEADVLVGGERLLQFFPTFAGEKIVIKSSLNDLVAKIKALQDSHNIVVLASGTRCFTASPGISRANSARISWISGLISARCSWHSRGLARAGKTPCSKACTVARSKVSPSASMAKPKSRCSRTSITAPLRSGRICNSSA